jgi:hypothetical protein
VTEPIYLVLADPRDAFLCLFFSRGCWLRRELKYRCFLTIAKHGQQDDTPIGEFERVMMRPLLVLVDLTKDRRVCPVVSSADAKGPAVVKTTSLEKASSVPGRTQTATAGSSGAANPRVPVPKLRVVRSSPTLAGRDPADCKLKSHMPRHSSVEAPSKPGRIKQYDTTENRLIPPLQH